MYGENVARTVRSALEKVHTHAIVYTRLLLPSWVAVHVLALSEEVNCLRYFLSCRYLGVELSCRIPIQNATRSVINT